MQGQIFAPAQSFRLNTCDILIKILQKSAISLSKEREENAFPPPIFCCSLLFFTCDKALYLAKYLLLGIAERYALEVAFGSVIVGLTLFEVC